jgi:uncharacterized protein YigA (DUF484 family)
MTGPAETVFEGEIELFLQQQAPRHHRRRHRQLPAEHAGFFERHAELLASVQLTSPHGQRAVSLQERQMEMLRERIKGLERKIIEMIRHGQDNVAIADRLHRWTRALMLVARRRELPRCWSTSSSTSS